MLPSSILVNVLATVGTGRELSLRLNVRQHWLVLIIGDRVLSWVVHIDVGWLSIPMLPVSLVNRRLPLGVGQVRQAGVLAKLLGLLLVSLVILLVVLLLIPILLEIFLGCVMIQHLLSGIHLTCSFVLVSFLPVRVIIFFAALYWLLEV